MRQQQPHTCISSGKLTLSQAQGQQADFLSGSLACKLKRHHKKLPRVQVINRHKGSPGGGREERGWGHIEALYTHVTPSDSQFPRGWPMLSRMASGQGPSHTRARSWSSTLAHTTKGLECGETCQQMGPRL